MINNPAYLLAWLPGNTSRLMGLCIKGAMEPIHSLTNTDWSLNTVALQVEGNFVTLDLIMQKLLAELHNPNASNVKFCQGNSVWVVALKGTMLPSTKFTIGSNGMT